MCCSQPVFITNYTESDAYICLVTHTHPSSASAKAKTFQ
ncbi:hypothetical protein CFC21_064382 [Triticum aestivum]|uniref:Uncharacterized protein n=1 Tax=Triticum aestivum TaxID=4565 RepID=A0A9R1H1B4_WHEAT|nr:hypothetical protein CFC21_064382 [Triticum aestivum]